MSLACARRSARTRWSRGPPGYVLEVEADRVDVGRFERLLGEGREALARGAAGLAAERLGAALALWRGPALADVRDSGVLALEARRLDDLRLVCIEERIEAELSLGPARRARPGARAPCRRGTAPRAPVAPAGARPLPLRARSRCARRVPSAPNVALRSSSVSSRARSCERSSARFCATTSLVQRPPRNGTTSRRSSRASSVAKRSSTSSRGCCESTASSR